MPDKIHISYSELADFLNCNYKHYLGYTKKLKTKSDTIHLEFGKIIHETIEKYLKKERDKYQSYKHFNESLLKKENIKKYGADLIKYRSQGLKILNEFFNRYNWYGIKVIGTEYELFEPIFSNYYFKGFIDLIYEYNGFIYIADNKTASNEWNHYKFDDEHFGLQLKLYKYFYCQKNKISYDKIKTVYIVLNRDENNENAGNLITIHEVKSDETEMKKVYKILTESLNTIYNPEMYEKYLQRTIGWNCNVCEFNGGNWCEGNIKTRFYKEIKKN